MTNTICCDNYHSLGGVNNVTLFSHSHKGRNSKVNVLAGFVPGQDTLPDLQIQASHYVLAWPFLSACGERERNRERTSSLVSLLRRTLILGDQGTTLNDLI